MASEIRLVEHHDQVASTTTTSKTNKQDQLLLDHNESDKPSFISLLTSSSLSSQSSPISVSSSLSSLVGNSNTNDNLNTTITINKNNNSIDLNDNENLIQNNQISNLNNNKYLNTTSSNKNSIYDRSLSTPSNYASKVNNNNNKNTDDSTSVRVAVRIRPQSTREKIEMCKVCTNVIPNEPQVILGNKDDKSFTYDYVYDMQSNQENIFKTSVENLIDGCFEGYNATVLAYGQTGSGKTYTMGTSFDPSLLPEEEGIIPRAISYLFHRVNQLQNQYENRYYSPKFSISAQFMELYNEEIIDLFDQIPSTTITSTIMSTSNYQSSSLGANESFFLNKSVCITNNYKNKIEIHEDQYGIINIQGCSVREVHSVDETLEMLKNGARLRTTGATNMNLQSSRSHAIFTLHIRQTRLSKQKKSINLNEINNGSNRSNSTINGNDEEFNYDSSNEDEAKNSIIDLSENNNDDNNNNENEFETLTAKFHFVDLAGSERLKRTGATGHRAKEGICINRGLLALGNVISALGDKEKRGCHVPYRDSKLTRLLQDSLGGNSRTLMIACVSPSDRDFMETLNTLRYANRARNIKNKVLINQDKTSKQIAQLKAEIERLNYELMQYKTRTSITKAQIPYSTSGVSASMSSSRTTSTVTIVSAVNSNVLATMPNYIDNTSNSVDFLNVLNDLKQENNLLLKENQNMRLRLKAMQETIESTNSRNCELEMNNKCLLENIRMHSINDALLTPITNDEKELNDFKNYIQQNEELKTKLFESESYCKHLQNYLLNRTSSPPSRFSTPAFIKTNSEDSYTNDSSYFLNDDLANKFSICSINQSLLNEAKNEVENDLKQYEKLKLNLNKTDSISIENIDDNYTSLDKNSKSNEQLDNYGVSCTQARKCSNSETNLTKSVTSARNENESEEDYKQRLELEKNLNDISLEIDLKKRLINELESNSRNLEQMKVQYEEKMSILHERIKQIEEERDKIIANMTRINENNKYDDQIKKIKAEYELKLKNLQSDLIKYEQIKQKNSQMLKNALETEKQLQQLRKEILEMKKLRVKLINQLRDEALKSKQEEQKRNKEIAILKRDHLKKDNQIKSLEAEKRCREIVLKRKQEQIQALRRYSTRMSDKVSGRTVNRTSSNNNTPNTNNNPKFRRDISTNGNKKLNTAMQLKWDKIDHSINAIIVKKQTIGIIEREMERFLEQRERIGRRLNRFVKRLEKELALEALSKDSSSNASSTDQNIMSNSTCSDLNTKSSTTNQSENLSKIDELREQIDIMRSNVEYLQDQIAECQTNIIQLDEAKDGDDFMILEELLQTVSSMDEAKFILKKFLALSLNKGVLAAQKEYVNNELECLLEQFERDYYVQQQLLQEIIGNEAHQHPIDNNNTSFSFQKNINIQNNNFNSLISNKNSNYNDNNFNNENFEIDEIILAPHFDDSTSESEDEENIPKDNGFDKSVNRISKDINQYQTQAEISFKARQLITNGPQEFLFANNSINDTSESTSTSAFQTTTTTATYKASTPPQQLNQETSNMLQASRICSKSYTKIPEIINDPSNGVPTRSAKNENQQKKAQINGNIMTTSAIKTSSINSSNSMLNNIPLSKSAIVTASDKSNFNRMSRSSISRQESKDSIMSTSPPGSPNSRRNPLKDENVFSRLTSETKQSPMPEQGIIKPYSGNTSRFRSSPISLTHVAEGHSKAVLSIDSHDLKLFTSSKDRTAKIWDLVTGQEISSMNGHTNNVTKIKYCDVNKLCFTVSTFYAKVWDLREAPSKCIKVLNSSGLTNSNDLMLGQLRNNNRVLQNEIPFGEKLINDLVVDKSGNYLLSASGSSVKIWDLRYFQPVGKISGGNNALITTLLIDDNLIITGSKDHYIKIFEMNQPFSKTYSLHMKPPYLNGADAQNGQQNTQDNFNQLNLMNISINSKYNLTPPHYDGVQSLCRFENSLFSCSRDMCIKKWSMSDYQCKQSINNAHKDWICSLDYITNYNNNDILLSGCRGGYLKFWNINTLEKIADFRAHLCPINSIKVNNNLIFTASDDATVRIWRRHMNS